MCLGWAGLVPAILATTAVTSARDWIVVQRRTTAYGTSAVIRVLVCQDRLQLGRIIWVKRAQLLRLGHLTQDLNSLLGNIRIGSRHGRASGDLVSVSGDQNSGLRVRPIDGRVGHQTQDGN